MPDELTTEETAALAEMQAEPELTDAEADAALKEVADAPEESTEEAAAEVVAEKPAEKPVEFIDPAKPPAGFVPHAAMHEERMKRQALEAELEALKAKAAEKPLEVPDPILDPDGFKAFMAGTAKEQAEWRASQEAQRKAEDTQIARLQTAAQYEQQFAAQTPDYMPAVAFLAEHRKAELTTYGYPADRIDQMIGQDINILFDNAVAAGKNPAAVLYDLAKHRGYQAKVADTTAADRMKALDAAAANSGTLATAGGPSQTGGLTVGQLAAMSEAEIAKIPKETIARVMGG